MRETAPLAAYSIGTYQDSNGFKVRLQDGTFTGWVYRMDYIDGGDRLWGAISNARDDVQDRSLYREGFPSRRTAADWLVDRWLAEASAHE